jgi:hypothetical protein
VLEVLAGKAAGLAEGASLAQAVSHTSEDLDHGHTLLHACPRYFAGAAKGPTWAAHRLGAGYTVRAAFKIRRYGEGGMKIEPEPCVETH